MFVKLDTNFVLETLAKNCEQYVESMEALMAAWKQKSDEYMVAYAEYVAEKLKGTEVEKPEAPPVPHNHLEDYKKYLTALENHLGPRVKMSVEEHNMIIRDRWHWTGRHSMTLDTYATLYAGTDTYLYSSDGAYLCANMNVNIASASIVSDDISTYFTKMAQTYKDRA